jgi:hypothetical protein
MQQHSQELQLPGGRGERNRLHPLGPVAASQEWLLDDAIAGGGDRQRNERADGPKRGDRQRMPEVEAVGDAAEIHDGSAPQVRVGIRTAATARFKSGNTNSILGANGAPKARIRHTSSGATAAARRIKRVSPCV